MGSLNETRQSLTQEIDEHENHLKTLQSTFKQAGGESAKPKPAKEAETTGTVEAKFKADPQMKAYKLGKKEADGRYQVLDQSGKLIGHYQ
jgi:uncharacterized protein (DUF342 family)